MHTSDSHRFRSWSRTGLAAGSAILTAILLVGCSSVPDAVNPVSWYDGVSNWVSSSSDDAGDDTPTPKAEKVSKGLSADRTNAKYTDDTPNREGSPTRPLNPDAVAARAASKTASVQTAEAAPPPPAVQATVLAPVNTPAPVGNPAPVNNPAPVGNSLPAYVQANSAGQSYRAAPAGNETVDQVYRRRLSEFDKLPVQQPGVAFQPVQGYRTSMNAPTAPAYGQAPTPYAPMQTAYNGSSQGQVIHLIRPSQSLAYGKTPTSRNASGARSLADYTEGRSSSSFDVATLGFGEGTSELTPAGRSSLTEVANLYHQKGGTLRIIASSVSPRLDVDPSANREANRALARSRADAVASELVRLGVPARKIYAGAADDSSQVAGGNGDGAEILLDM